MRITNKRKISKIVGRISHDVASKYDLYEYEGKEIIQSLDLYIHIQKHIHEFESVDSYSNSVFNIEKIISDPYFVYYDKKKESLLYYKKIDEFTCVVVKLTLRRNKDIYVSTMYPVSEEKIEKMKQKAIIEKYTYSGTF